MPRTEKTAPDHHDSRRRRLRTLLRARGLGAYLVTNPRDIRFLTGFTGEDSWLVLTPRQAVVVSDFRFAEELSAIPGVTVLLRKGAIAEAAADAIPATETAGIQAEHTTVATRATLARLIGARRIKNTIGLVAGLRIIKDETEIALIRRAIAVQERAFLETLEVARPGMREADIAADLEHRMRSLGAEGPAFPTIVAAGPNGSKPHYRPGPAKARSGGTLLVDWGAVVAGYHSDMTRTISFGRWPRAMREIYAVVLEAHEAGIAAVAPGRKCAAVDAEARSVIERAGLGERFGHGLGHGIGLDIHEAPRLSKISPDVLAPGMVVTIEPGVYIPGVGGVRIEDDVLVTERGARRLSTLPKAVDWAAR